MNPQAIELWGVYCVDNGEWVKAETRPETRPTRMEAEMLAEWSRMARRPNRFEVRRLIAVPAESAEERTAADVIGRQAATIMEGRERYDDLSDRVGRLAVLVAEVQARGQGGCETGSGDRERKIVTAAENAVLRSVLEEQRREFAKLGLNGQVIAIDALLNAVAAK